MPWRYFRELGTRNGFMPQLFYLQGKSWVWGWVSPRDGLDTGEKPLQVLGIKSDSSVIQLIAQSLYWLSFRSSHKYRLWINSNQINNRIKIIKMERFDCTVSEVNSYSSWSLCSTHMEPLFYGVHAFVPNCISDIYLYILS